MTADLADAAPVDEVDGMDRERFEREIAPRYHPAVLRGIA